MESAKSKPVLDKISLNHIAVDLGLSFLVGSAISLIIFLGFYRFKGAANLLEIIPMYFVLIFVNTPYSGLFRLVELVPNICTDHHHFSHQEPGPKGCIPEGLGIYSICGGCLLGPCCGHHNDRRRADPGIWQGCHLWTAARNQSAFYFPGIFSGGDPWRTICPHEADLQNTDSRDHQRAGGRLF